MVSRETLPPDLPGWLGPAAPALTQYAELLVGPGIDRGLLGPREAPRMWDRHILNCAVVADPQAGFLDLGCGSLTSVAALGFRDWCGHSPARTYRSS